MCRSGTPEDPALAAAAEVNSMKAAKVSVVGEIEGVPE
jgi:hypothetical protein